MTVMPRKIRQASAATATSLNSGSCVQQVVQIGQVIRDEIDNKKDLSGIGGVESGRDAAEFLLLGANSVQVSL